MRPIASSMFSPVMSYTSLDNVISNNRILVLVQAVENELLLLCVDHLQPGSVHDDLPLFLLFSQLKL